MNAVPALQQTLSTARHHEMFDAARFGRTRIDVVGCGSVGSRIAMEVARLGVHNLHIHDFDMIEAHNIANQVHFDLADIGRSKVEVLAEKILAGTGTTVTVHKERVSGPTEFGKVVFIAVDSMATRKEIFEHSLKMKIVTDVMIEIRMGVEEFRVYGLNPHSLREVRAWEGTLYEGEPKVGNACQTHTTIGATAGLTACFAVHRFLQWYRRDFVRDPDHKQPPHFEQIVMLRPLTVIKRGVD